MAAINFEDVLYLMLLRDWLEESLELDEDERKEKIQLVIDCIDEFTEKLHKIIREKGES